MSRFTFLTAIAMLVVPASFAGAQPSRIPNALLEPQKVHAITVLTAPPAVESLQLDADQQETVAMMQQELEEAVAKARRKAAESMEPLMRDMLRPDQQQKLRSLQVRSQGIVSLLIDEDVQQQLRVTPRQLEQLRQIQDDFQRKLKSAVGPEAALAGIDFAALALQLRNAMEQREHDLLAVLSQTQRRQWFDLLADERP